jgi:hypothetical protein
MTECSGTGAIQPAENELMVPNRQAPFQPRPETLIAFP